MTPRNWLMLILTAALFGSSFPLTKLAVAEIAPAHLAAARVLVAAPFVLAFLYASGRRLPRPGQGWAPLFGLGLLTAAIPYFAIAWGQSHIASSLGGILFATIPIFTVIFAPVFTDEAQLSAAQLLGVAIAFAGVVAAIGPDTLTLMSAQTAGAAVTLSAALSYALGNIYARRQTTLDPVQMAAGQLVTATVFLLPLGMATAGTQIDIPGPAAISALLGLAVISTALPVLLMFMLVRQIGATRTSLLAFFIPVAALIFGVVLLGDSVNALTLTGFAMIIAGAFWVTRQQAGQPVTRKA